MIDFQPSMLIKSHFFYKEKTKEMRLEYGLNIIDKSDQQYFDFSWDEITNNNSKVDLVFLNSNYIRYYSRKVLADAMDKYSGVLSQHLDHVLLLSTIDYYGVNVGGLYDFDTKSILISIKNTYTGLNKSATAIEAVFHHEFSSFLLKKYSLNEDKWRNSHSEDFKYESDIDPFYFSLFMQGNVDKKDKEALYRRGLIKQYYETGFENDFNVYAEMVFTRPYTMKLLIARYPVIKRKYEVFKAFYLSIDQGFASVFEKIDG